MMVVMMMISNNSDGERLIDVDETNLNFLTSSSYEEVV
jgi:hypothetical protein